jgi:plastocyanin
MAATVVLAVVASACSSSSTPSGSGTTQPPPASPSASPTATASDDNGGETSATIQAGKGGFVFSPNTLTVAQGATLTVKNAGTVPHTFTIQSNNINEVMQPGQSATINLSLAPGTYPFVCTFHQSSGMTGTLTVS